MAYSAAGECGDREFEAMEGADRVSAEFDGTRNVNAMNAKTKTQRLAQKKGARGKAESAREAL